MKRITVKVGSNVLTRSDGNLDFTRMSALVDQIVELRRRGIDVVLVSSGAVASGRGEMRMGSTDLDEVSARQLFSAVGQAKLMNRYFELFRNDGIFCGQVLTTKENFADTEHYRNQKRCMEVMLANGVVPIVNENDTVSITELMFTDNDELSGLIAEMVESEILVILSNVDGIYDGDPAEPSSRVIPEIRPQDSIDGFISSKKSSLGRGGMVSKCSVARRVAAAGIPVVLANGKREDILLKIFDAPAGTLCTRFLPK
jgi:glutamate 5-kinase